MVNIDEIRQHMKPFNQTTTNAQNLIKDIRDAKIFSALAIIANDEKKGKRAVISVRDFCRNIGYSSCNINYKFSKFIQAGLMHKKYDTETGHLLITVAPKESFTEEMLFIAHTIFKSEEVQK